MEDAQNRVAFVVSPDYDRMLIREFLMAHNISERALKRLRNRGVIYCNGQEITWRKVVHAGDKIIIVYPIHDKSNYLKSEEVSLEILYEDRDIVLINKQAGICIHPTLAHPSGTLANGLMYHWLEAKDEASFHAVNRIDRDTSGIVLVAKNSFSAQQLFLQRQQQHLLRSYIALVHGVIRRATGSVDLPIEKYDGRTTKRKISNEGQRAVTFYKVLTIFEDYTLLGLKPETGRTHQIRVHLAHLGHPLVGDRLYGGSNDKISRHCLHADRLCFFHPRNGNLLSFQTPCPEDIGSLIKNLASR